MAYSDYGGYAYRNGVHVIERSDAVLTPESDIYSTPGMYPGFGMVMDGLSYDEIMKRQQWPSGHAVLGDGPVHVVLRKTYAIIYLNLQEYEIDEWIDYKQDLSYESTSVDVEGHKIELVHMREDNLYIYAKLEHPNSVVWHGWSGYGVGAGHESGSYGFSTPDRIRTMKTLWPESVKE